jgi:hypothetical protein
VSHFKQSLKLLPIIQQRLPEIRERSVDVRRLGDELEAPDSVTNQTFYNHLCISQAEESIFSNYRTLRTRTILLSNLREIYALKDTRKALAVFKTINDLRIDPAYTVDTDDPNSFFSHKDSFLDFLLVVGADTGIDVWIPNRGTDHLFAINLNLRLQLKEFRSKNGILGFNPSGAMLCLAQNPSEDMWIGFAKQDDLDEAGDPFQLDQKHGDTRLSRQHYRIVLAFLCYCLQAVQARNYYILEDYPPEIFSPKILNIALGTNVL